MQVGRGQAGMALALVLVTVALLGASVVGLMGALRHFGRNMQLARLKEQAFYAAEAGVQQTVAWTYYWSTRPPFYGFRWTSEPRYAGLNGEDAYVEVLCEDSLDPDCSLNYLDQQEFSLTWGAPVGNSVTVTARGRSRGGQAVQTITATLTCVPDANNCAQVTISY